MASMLLSAVFFFSIK
jgi:hypothetical protein